MNAEFGNIIYKSDEKIVCQVFPEGNKKSFFYVCVLTDEALYFPDNSNSFNEDVLAGMCKEITDYDRVIPLSDIERILYPTEDVKIMLWLKRKGNRNMRIYRKSTGKSVDVCIGREEDTKKVYELLKGVLK